MEDNKCLAPLPVVGETYNFFDDGKIRDTRLYKATIKEILTVEDAKNTYFDNGKEYDEISLYDIWIEQVNDHKNTDNFQVLPYEFGEPWLYDKKTDYFIIAEIQDYWDDTNIFVRDVRGDWFSFGIKYPIGGGVLDVTGDKYREYLNAIENISKQNNEDSLS